MLSKAFSGHGTFIYLASSTLEKYNNDPKMLAKAMKNAGMSHGWVRLHSWNKTTNKPKVEPYTPTRRLIDGLRDEGIHVAGWGWNQGVEPRTDADIAAEQMDRYGIKDYVADIEHEHSGAIWTKASIRKYFSRLNQNLDYDSQVLVSSFGFIGWHSPELMQEAEPYVHGFAPQVYWFYFPKPNMLNRPDLPAGEKYPLANPASYTRMCADMWRHYVSKPLVITGQSYWGESATYTRPVSEKKLTAFLNEFNSWNQIHGFNWWHLGHRGNSLGSGAMSKNMMTQIQAHKLNSKNFKT